MKLVNAITVVNDFKASYHVTGKVGLLFVSHLISDWVLVWRGFSHFNVKVLLGLHSAFESGYRSVCVKR